MRRLLFVAVVLSVVTLVSSLGPASVEATTCTTTCSRGTLSCTPTTSCSSVPGTSLTCDGVVTTCSTANPWCDCIANCGDCTECVGYVACQICANNLNSCRNNCGPKPANVTACEGVIIPLP